MASLSERLEALTVRIAQQFNSLDLSGGGGSAAKADLQIMGISGFLAPSTVETVLVFDTVDIIDTGYTYLDGVVTIGAELDGARVAISASAAVVFSNRTQLKLILQTDVGAGWVNVLAASNYNTRDFNQNEGTTNLTTTIATVSAGHKFRIVYFLTQDGTGDVAWLADSTKLTMLQR
jgi:hypothetical protein